jgi:hypothetical protein
MSRIVATDRYSAMGPPKPGCPVHGRANIAFHPATTINGIEDPAMESCVACMDAGASPMGAWSRYIEDGGA